MVSLFHSLTDQVFADDRFQSDAGLLLVHHFDRTLGVRTIGDSTPKPVQVKRLAESALIAASSPDSAHRKAGFEIGTLLAEDLMEEYPAISEVLRTMCMRIGIAPTASMLPDNSRFQPLSISVENSIQLAQCKVEIGTDRPTFTQLQLDTLHLLSDGNSVSVSAPTSAGKSYLITQHVASQFLDRKRFICLVVVPTRALIRQFAHDFAGVFNHYNLPLTGTTDRRVILCTSSLESEDDTDAPRRLFVLTQERLQSILYSWSHRPHFDLVIVDESQKVSDESRGVILEDSIREIARTQNTSTFIFLSPLSSNPNFMLELLTEKHKKQSIVSDISPVGQHIYSIRRDPNDSMSLVIRKLYSVVDNFEYRVQLTKAISTKKQDRFKRMAEIAILLGGNERSILYASGPSDAEKLAEELSRSLPDVESPPSSNISNAIELLSGTIHSDYLLIQCLRKRTGYHYGDMPDLARTLVEDLFKSGDLQWVVCTSTLLEGVNLPAKNVFIDNPYLGKKEMPANAFWNLAGRAGRLMKELSGNVFCVLTDDWKIDLSDLPRTYEIESSLRRTIDSKQFLDYCVDPVPKKIEANCGQTLNHLLLRLKRDGETSTKYFLETQTNAQQVESIMQRILPISNVLDTLPSDLAAKNKNIDFRLQNRLLSWLKERPLDELMSLAPRSPRSPDFYERLLVIFRLTDQYLGLQSKGERYKYYTLLANRWLRETTFQEIIANAIAFDQQKYPDSKGDVNRVVRNLIGDLNTSIRFRYVQNVKCFCELYQYVWDLRQTAHDQRPAYVDFRLPAYLELGLWNEKAIELSKIGMSRSAAIETAKHCQAQSSQVAGWLQNNLGRVMNQVSYPTRVEIERIFTTAA